METKTRSSISQDSRSRAKQECNQRYHSAYQETEGASRNTRQDGFSTA